MKNNIFCGISGLLLACIAVLTMNCDNGSPTSPAVVNTGLEGTWKGKALGDTTTYFITFSENNFTFKSSAFSLLTNAYTGTFSTDTNADPKQMDAHIAQCPINSQFIGKTSLCIYKISHDTLTYAGNEPGDMQRPNSFVYDATGITEVIILKKQ